MVPAATGSRVLILGYGSFGRAVHAALANRAELAISVYSRSPKDFLLPPAELFSAAASIPVATFDIVVVALPSHALREVLGQACSTVPLGTAFLSCVKGMDAASSRLPSDVIYEATGSDYSAVMSGASFADEMLAGRPVYLTLACANLSLGRELIARIESPKLNLELTDDVRGLEVAGVGKNIIALGAGLADGLGLGENFRASFIARGVVELQAVADKLGGRSETIVAAGALSDFFLSCLSPRSRNYAEGVRLAGGASEPVALAEGLLSARSFVRLLDRNGIRSPYFEAVVAALANPPAIARALAAHI